MAAIQDATLVVQALHIAIARRRPQGGLLHHTDRGSTYTSESYQALLRQEGMVASMSRTADCYDTGAMESFFYSFKGECIDGESFQTRAIGPSTLLLGLIAALQQGLCPLSKIRWDRKVQGISEPINDIEQSTHVNGLQHGLLTDPCRLHCRHIRWLDGFGREGQLFQVPKHGL
jgi:transposase InsO family protein